MKLVGSLIFVTVILSPLLGAYCLFCSKVRRRINEHSVSKPGALLQIAKTLYLLLAFFLLLAPFAILVDLLWHLPDFSVR